MWRDLSHEFGVVQQYRTSYIVSSRGKQHWVCMTRDIHVYSILSLWLLLCSVWGDSTPAIVTWDPSGVARDPQLWTDHITQDQPPLPVAGECGLVLHHHHFPEPSLWERWGVREWHVRSGRVETMSPENRPGNKATEPQCLCPDGMFGIHVTPTRGNHKSWAHACFDLLTYRSSL